MLCLRRYTRLVQSAMSVVRQWLPPAEAEAALQEDPRRFAAVFSAVRASWDASKTLDPSLRSLKTLEWLALVRRCRQYVHILSDTPHWLSSTNL